MCVALSPESAVQTEVKTPGGWEPYIRFGDWKAVSNRYPPKDFDTLVSNPLLQSVLFLLTYVAIIGLNIGINLALCPLLSGGTGALWENPEANVFLRKEVRRFVERLCG